MKNVNQWLASDQPVAYQIEEDHLAPRVEEHYHGLGQAYLRLFKGIAVQI